MAESSSMDSNTFLRKHLDDIQMGKWNAINPVGSQLNGKAVIADAPLYNFDKFLACVLFEWKTHGYKKPAFIIANEAAALMFGLLLAGFSPEELVALRVDGTLDTVNLIAGKTRLTGKLSKLHKTKKGAEHKGLRLRDTLNTLIRSKVGGLPDALYTLDEFRNATGVLFTVTAFEKETNEVVCINAETCPSMSVADAILATCSVQPYIREVDHVVEVEIEKKGKMKKSKEHHTFITASGVCTFPYQQSRAILVKAGIPSSAIQSKTVGFACKQTKNPYAKEGYDTLRPGAVFPPELARSVKLY